MNPPAHRLILIAVALFAVLISFTSLLSQSIRLDESQSIWVATKSVPGILNFMAKDVHPPLYILILHFVIRIFGTGLFAVRIPSLIFILATIPALYRLARESSNTKTALITVIFFILSPFMLWFSNETRMYTLLTFASTVSHLFFLRMIKSGYAGGKTGYFFASLIGIYTHYFFLLVLISQTAYVIYISIRERSFPWPFIAMGMLLFDLFLPWGWYVGTLGFASNSQPALAPPTIYTLIGTYISFFFGFQSPAMETILVSLWPLLVIFFFLMFTSRGSRRILSMGYFLTVTFAPMAITFAVSFVRPVFLPRYLIFTLPTLFFLLAWSLTNSTQKFTEYVATLLLIIMAGFLIIQNMSSNSPAKEDYADIAAYVGKEATSRDLVAISSPFTIYPLEYAYTGHARIVTIPAWDRYRQTNIPAFSDNTLISQMKEYDTLYYRFFLILSYDQGYEKRIIDYMDTHYALLTNRKFSPGVELRVYRLRYD